MKPSVARRIVTAAIALTMVASATPLLAAPARTAAPATARYIATVAPGAAPRHVAAGHAGAPGLQVARTFSAPLRSFVVDATASGARRLRADRRIVRLELDRPVRATGLQTSPTWGLDRSDQQTLPLDGTYTHDGTGRGVTVYVVDSGVRGHDQFGTRLQSGFTAIHDGVGSDDCNGHGTHVAGTAAGAVHGIAKEATIVPVRVLDCAGTGTTSGVIAGLDWIIQHRSGPAVANLSLSGGSSASLDDAVRRTIASGTTVVAAAGNDGADACTRSPARVAEALTVAASDRYDSRPSWSNFGTCVDTFAPGASITSTGTSSRTATATKSGTSMAAPHVAGAAAIAHELRSGATPTQVADLLLETATTGRIQSAGSGTPNRLLFTALLQPTAPVVTEPQNASPTAAATASCSGTTCTFDARTSTDPDGVVTTHAWSFSDGRTATTPTVTLALTTTGTFTGTVTVADDRGATDTATVDVSCGWQGKGRNKSLSCTDAESATSTSGKGRPVKKKRSTSSSIFGRTHR